MQRTAALVSLLLVWATGAMADGFRSLKAEAWVNTADIARAGTPATFKDNTQTSAHGVYDLGAWTIFGGLETQRTDFSANGGAADDMYKNVYLDLGAEHSFGTFGLGGQLAYISFENDGLGVDSSVNFVSAYGQYQSGGLVAGGGLFYTDTRKSGRDDESETGVLAFVSNDFGNGLNIGAQATVQSDHELVELYADYTFAKGDIRFSLINTSGAGYVVQFASLEGRYNIYKQVSATAGILNSDEPYGDNTTEISTGLEYAFGDGAAARIEYVEYGAFNGFSGNGITFGLTYDIGNKRKSGYQPIGKTFADKNSAVFYVY